MKPKITTRLNQHNALIFRDVLALFVYRLHFVLLPVLSPTFRCSAWNTLSLNGLQSFGYKSPNLLRFYLLKIAVSDPPGPVFLYPQR